MKFGRATWVFLIIGILIIAGASLGSTYRNLADEQEALKNQIQAARDKTASVNVADLSSRESTLKSQMAENNAKAMTIKESLKQPVDAISTTEALFGMAKDAGIEISDLSSAGLASEKLEKMPFTSLTVTVKVKGEASKIIDFVNKITAQYSTELSNR